MLKKMFLSCFLILLIALVADASASSSYDEVYAEYPKDRYLVGIGEVDKTGNSLNNKRVAEVLARLEIAKQIKVRLREETVDIMCEGGSARLFKDILECKNEFIMIVEVTVDEFLEGSRIVKLGENKGIVYAVAVMPKAVAVKELDNKVKESVDNTKENIEKAKEGDKEALNEAQEEYMKAVTYDKEKELIEGVKSRASDMFEELEKELVKLREKE
jgi:hypothetical protein